MAHCCLRISLHIFSVGFLLLFECLKVGYLHMMGKITKKENHFIVLLFYLLIFMLFHFRDSFNLMYLHGIVLFYIIVLKFLFWTFGFCFTDQEVYLLGYVLSTTPSILKRKMLYHTPSKKNLSQLSFTTLYKVATWPSNLAIGERFDHIHFPGLQWCYFTLDFPNHAMGKKIGNIFRLTPCFK